MKRPRGRRVALLLASALPLLAEHDVVLASDDGVPVSADSRAESEESLLGKKRKRSLSITSSNETLPACCPCDCSSGACFDFDAPRLASWDQNQCEDDCSNECFGDIKVPYRPPWEDFCFEYLTSINAEEADEEEPVDIQQSSEVTDQSTLNAETVTTDDDSDSAVDAAVGMEAKPTTAVASPPSASPSNTFMDAVDYASKAAGALILEASSGLDGAANLLTKDKDKYAIADCQDLKQTLPDQQDESVTVNQNYFVVIGLSEDILVKRIVLANYERYSSPFREFTVYGSPTADGNWMYQLGNFEMQLQQGKQSFDLQQPVWARYLKFEFKSYYGDEHYCTLSQIMVHGSTVLQGFHEQWAAEDGAVADEKATVVEPAATATSYNQNDEGNDSRNETLVEGAENNGIGSASIATGMSVSSMTTSSHGLIRNGRSLEFKSPDFASLNESDPNVTWGALSAASICLSNCQFAQATSLSLQRGAVASGIKTGEVEQVLFSADTAGNHDMKSGWTEVKLVRAVYNGMKSTGLKDRDFDNALADLRNMKRTMTSGAHRSSDNTIMDEPSPDFGHSAEKTVAKSEESGRSDAVSETNERLVKLLKRYPSADCLLQLDLATFKAKFLKPRPGASGQDAAGVAAMEPIFKKLKDEIKGMQAAIALQDQYASESLLCYQRIIMDLLMDMESTRLDHSLRLERLEKETSTGLRIVLAMQELFVSIMALATIAATSCLDTLIMKEYGAFISFIRLTMGSSVLVFVCCLVAWLCQWILSSKSKVNSQSPRKLRPYLGERKSISASQERGFHYLSDDSSSDTGEQGKIDAIFPSFVSPATSTDEADANFVDEREHNQVQTARIA